MKTKFNGILTLLLAFVVQLTFAQSKTISGVVSDGSDSLPGVSIIVKGTSIGTETDFDGNYSITTNVGDVLQYSFVGMDTVEETVGASNIIDVTMQGNVLDEVVVIGYSNKKRGNLSSAISSVTAAQLEKQNNSVSIDNALQGVATGVQVTAQNGKPGNAAFVRIRGIGSINAGSEPLYLLDGIQVDEDDIIGINPSDIKSMVVLKDAASTAIYGARGANGVIVITTKSGKKNKKAQIRLQTRLGLSDEIKKNFRVMNAREKLEYERAIGVPGSPGATTLLQSEWDRLISLDHDWDDDLFKQAQLSSVNLSVSGGDEKLDYFMSLSNDTNSGIITLLESAFERTSTRLNVGYDANDWLRLSTKLSFSTSNDQDPRDRNNIQNPVSGRYTFNPYEPVYLTDANGDRIPNVRGLDTFNPTHQGLNSLAQVRANEDNDTDNRFFGTFTADVKITDNISYQLLGSTSYFNRTARGVLHAGSALDLIFNGTPTGTSTATNSNRFIYSILNKINYSKTFNEKHDFNFLMLMEYQENNFETATVRSQGFVVNGPTTVSAGATPLITRGFTSVNTLFSTAASLDYVYDSKYVLNATVRRDGSSKFGANTKYGTFWGASAAWNIHNEGFYGDLANTLNTLKIRFSAGTSGNDQIGNFPSQTLYGFESYNGQTTSAPNQFGDPNLGWEQSFNYGVGLEFGLFDSRITGVVDYYKKETSDLLLSVPISLIQGGGSVLRNVGEVENSGYEFELRGDVIKNENFRWNVGATLSLYDSKVIKLADDNDLFIPAARYTGLRVGEEVHTFYLSRYIGVNPANGQALFLDENGNGTTSNGGNVFLSGKTPYATFDGGINTSISYKGFDLTADLYYKGGNYIYNEVENQLLSDGTGANSNQRVDAFNYWQQPGDTNVLPNPVTPGYNGAVNDNIRTISSGSSTRYLQKGDYIRLRNLQIGYTLSSKFLEKTPLTQVRTYLSGTNLWTYVPYYKGDPEVGIGSAESNVDSSTRNQIPGEYSLNSYPTLSTISFGVDIKF
ncbi:MAG: SusC/RagA family TonB-linked outer membrane protein [Flavobacteriaceae bacterium]|nr:SusC/RagA family TonB-linked outer membrane protein [Flavobacteriaceae bacterium]